MSSCGVSRLMGGPPEEDVPDEAWEDDVCPPADEEDTAAEEAAVVLLLSLDVPALEDNGANELLTSADVALPTDDEEEPPPAEDADALDALLVADEGRLMDEGVSRVAHQSERLRSGVCTTTP